MTLLLELIAVAVLILLNGFFVAAEYGLVTVRRTRMHELEQKGSLRAHQVLQITESPPRFIAAMQLGVTLTSLAIGALGEQALAKAFDPVLATVLAVTLAYLILTFFHVVIGELVPKAIALGHSERTALTVAWPVRMFFVVAMPLIWLLRRSTRIVLGVFGLEEPGATGAVHSEAELRMLVSESTERGEIEQGEQEMLYKVFDFADKEVSDVMVPRPEVVALSVELPPEQALQAVLDSPVHALPGLPRLARRDRRRAPRARPDRGDARARDRVGACGGSDPTGVHGPRDEGSRGAADGVPAPEPAHGDRPRRVREHGGHRHARGRARGDRRRDRGRVRPAGRVGRARRRPTRFASTGRSRSTTSTSSSGSSCRRRTTTRSPASSSACSGAPPRSATRSSTTG